MNRATVYVYLLDEGTDVWRPVDAIHIVADLYRITGEKKDPTEIWQFQTGDIVRCEVRWWNDEESAVAVERIQVEPDSP